MTYDTYCQWFLATYNRPFTASREEFEAALRQPIIFAEEFEDPTYLDGVEEREGLWR